MPRRNRCYLSPYCTYDSSTDGNKRYFCIPKVKVGPVCEVTKKLSQKRRSLWLKVLGLTEAEVEDKERILICSRHFVSGQPEYEMYEKSVDWVPTLNIPVPKIIPIPPPTEEHSYCQTSIPPIAYNWKTTVSGKNKRIIQRRSHRVPILKKKKEKDIEKATLAQQKAEAIAEKIREKRRKKKRLALKKAKREEKIKRAEKEAARLLKIANKKSKMPPESMLNQITLIDTPIQTQSNLLPSNQDLKVHHILLEQTSEASKECDVLGSESIPHEAEMINKLPSLSDISPKLTNGQPVHFRTEPFTEKHPETNMDVACTSKVTSSAIPTSKNEFLKQLMLSQIGQESGEKSTPVKIAPETRSNHAPKRATEPIKNTAKLPSKILILRKDASDKTSRTVITLKSTGNASCRSVQKNVENIMKQTQTHSQSETATSPTVVSSTTAISTNSAAPTFKTLQPASKVSIPRKGVAPKTPVTVATPKPTVNPSCHLVSKNTEAVEPEPASHELVLQNLRNVEAYIQDLILKKNASSPDTYVNSLLQKLIEHHQQNILGTGKLVSTARITQGIEDEEIIDLTKDDFDYILPDAAPNKLCSTCNCHNAVEEISFLRSELEKKSIELESCRSDLDKLKKELCEAKNCISNLSAQLQENTQALCSYLANSNPHEIQN